MKKFIKRHPVFTIFLVSLLFFILYAVTTQRGVSWQDSGEFQYRILAGDYIWRSGIARAHPLYIGIAQLFSMFFPDRLVFFSTNLLSAAGMGISLFLLGLIVWRRTASLLGTFTAITTLALSQMVWWMSTICEVYTWSECFFFAEIFTLMLYAEKKKTALLALLFFLNGLHAGIHNFAFLNVAVYGIILILLLREKRSVKPLFLCGSCWCIGAAPLLILAGREFLLGGSVPDIVASVLVGTGYGHFVVGITPDRIYLALANFALAALSFLSPVWLFALSGFRARPFPGKNALLWLTGIHFLFWVRYFVADQATFLLPTLGLLAIWCGLGIRRMEERQNARPAWILVAVLAGCTLSCLTPPTLSMALHHGRWKPQNRRQLGERDEISYWLLPWKAQEKSADHFILKIKKQLRPNDLLVCDPTACAPIFAARESGMLSKDWDLITIFDEVTSEEVAKKISRAQNAWIVSPMPGYHVHDELLSGKYTFKKEGELYRILTARQKNGSQTRGNAE